ILEELLTVGDDPADHVNDLLALALWPTHPLGREVLGDEATVGTLTPDEIRAFHDRHYTPATTVLAAAGRVEHGRLADALSRRFDASGRRPGGALPPRLGPPGPGRPLVVRRQRTEQVHIALGMPAPGRHDPSRHAVTLLVHILGGGASSRLFQEVRERRGLAYSVYAYRTGFDDAGMVGVYAGTAPKRAAETVRVIAGELDRLADGASERELAVARGNIVGSLALGLEDSGARMARIGRSQLVHGTVPTVDEVAGWFEAVTPDDLARTAAELLAGPRSLAVVGPVSEAAAGRWLP
ncbi:MAG TPA: pitrilysin family protein, partial [Acidimicrobiales bacterium]|nr:pitrilysin family protein [Acidimicrobiales bacterium]